MSTFDSIFVCVEIVNSIQCEMHVILSLSFIQLSPNNLFFFFFSLFRAVPVAHGGCQARGQIGAVAANLHHDHSNARSEPRL